MLGLIIITISNYIGLKTLEVELLSGAWARLSSRQPGPAPRAGAGLPNSHAPVHLQLFCLHYAPHFVELLLLFLSQIFVEDLPDQDLYDERFILASTQAKQSQTTRLQARLRSAPVTS
jgi:hypothetical protein